MQEFLRRRLNPFLLISTVVVLGILAGLSVTYQDVLSEKVSTNKQLQADLQEKRSRVVTLENMTQNLSTALSRTRQDLAATVNETQRQEQTISSLEDTVASLNGTVQSLEETVADQEATIDSLKQTIDEQETEIANLEANLTDICEDHQDNPAVNLSGTPESRCERWE